MDLYIQTTLLYAYICKNWAVDSKNCYNLHIKRIDDVPNSFFDELIVAAVITEKNFSEKPAAFLLPDKTTSVIHESWIHFSALNILHCNLFPAKNLYSISYHTTFYIIKYM